MARALLGSVREFSRSGRVHMANSKQLSSGTVAAEPEPIASRLVGHRARHHRHAARFHGARRLRRNARQRRLAAWPRAVKPIASVLSAARDIGMLVVHTREGHLPDLSDAPPAKIERGAPSLAHRRSRADGTDPDPRRSRPRHHSGAVSARQRGRDRQARARAHSTPPNSATSCRNTASRICWCAA